MEPLRDFQFRGVPHRTTATLVPYVDCLVEITEIPFTVVTIADINIANLERVGFGLRNFDLTFVFKVSHCEEAAAPLGQPLAQVFVLRKLHILSGEDSWNSLPVLTVALLACNALDLASAHLKQCERLGEDM